MLCLRNLSLLLVPALLLCVRWVAPVSVAAPKDKPTTTEEATFFEIQVKPILQAHCLSCHGGEKKIKGGLNLTSRAHLLKGGETGPAVSTDKPDDSLLLKAIQYRDMKMPPKGKLPQAQIDILTRWIKMGAPWSAGDTTVKRHGPPPVDDAARAFWSFRPVARPKVPEVKDAAWVKNPIDAFVLAKLEAANLQPAPPAERVALLRRLTYDLTGLPPTTEEVDAVLADKSAEWYERLIDRLLASPQYGERWGRHWLDLVRYAETNSFERDDAKPNVWRYRDYVIRSFNQDKPYDQFIREQLAGDEIEPVTPEGIIATGYYRLGVWDDEAVDHTQALYDDLDDIVATTGQVFLGLTVNCARCHDHKIDPFPQKDYYKMLGFFHGIQRYGVRSADTVAKASLRPIARKEEQEKQKEIVAAHQKKVDGLSAQLKEIEETVRPKLEGGERDDFKHEKNRLFILKKHVPDLLTKETFDRYQAIYREREKLQRTAPPALAQALCVTERGPTAPDTFVFQRGNPQAKGDKVEPGFPLVMTNEAAAAFKPGPDNKTSGRRRVLADWIASPDNALTSRVMVNRIWQYHFGRGIVRSASNYGYMGTPPTHPELLDWLASEFVARKWSVKAMHKLMLTSNAYRMSSRVNESALARDPENDLMWRFDLRRLSAEEVRDSILSVSGNLNLKMGGPSIYPTIPKEVLAGQSAPGYGWDLNCPPEERARRSVYVHIKRSLGLPILVAFDGADTDATCPVRFTTTQPTQALGMLNGEFLNEQAKVFAETVKKKAGDDVGAQVRMALRRSTQREPMAREIERGVAFIAKMRDKHKMAPDEALRTFCLLALNLNEFVYVD
ncbi:MAG: PSD1 and planctomycete cytochrome C domain-containing protein [Gemmataceae bacterium]|nr:PSD1 and planctomycete cytochrome C domain-containing protein [Gemmataceae bacterium]